MFTLDQIKQAHANVKSGADFPRYIQDLKALGILSYEMYVSDGKTKYTGSNGYTVEGTPRYPALTIAASGAVNELDKALKIHQAGGTDFPTFCKQAATFGVEKWKVDTYEMTCVYYNQNGEAMISEKIPS